MDQYRIIDIIIEENASKRNIFDMKEMIPQGKSEIQVRGRAREM